MAHLMSETFRTDLHVPCIRCRYDLFGAQSAGRCPECGSFNSLSLHPTRLYFVPLTRLRTLLWPIKLWTVCSCVFLVLVPLQLLYEPPALYALGDVIVLAICVGAPLLLARCFQPCAVGPVARGLVLFVMTSASLVFLGYVFLVVSPWTVTLHRPWPDVILGAPVIGYHLVLASLQRRVPSVVGVCISSSAAFGIVIMVFLIGANRWLGQFELYAKTQWMWFIGGIIATILLSFVGTILAWRSIRTVIAYRVERGGVK